MGKLIDAERFKKDLHENYAFSGFTDLLKDFYAALDSQPPVDAVPVRHGRWIHVSPEPEVMLGWMPWYCSECGVGVGKHQSTFCPNCGARMDGLERTGTDKNGQKDGDGNE